MYNKELGIIGVGKIGSTLLKRLITTKTVNENNIIIYDIDENRLKDRSLEFNVDIANNIIDLVKSSQYILIAVIPQVIDIILLEISSVLTREQILI